MFNLIELLKNIFFRKKAASDLVDNLKNSSELTNDQTHMLGNLLKLGNIQIRDIMVPRADIVSINIDSDFETTLKLFIEAAHSRLPVYKDQLDNIVGMLHVKDLLPYWQKNSKFSIEKVTRNVLFSSPAMLVNDLLEQMRATRTHLAIIVDEQGGTDGIVTIEDLVEEIVGEIEDEHDAEDGDEEIIKKEGNVIIANASYRADELEKDFNINFKVAEEEEIETVGGLIFSKINRIPKINEEFIIDEIVKIKVLRANERKIITVQITKIDN